MGHTCHQKPVSCADALIPLTAAGTSPHPPSPGQVREVPGTRRQSGAGRVGMGPGATILAPSSVSPCESAVGCEPLPVALSPGPERSVHSLPPHPPRLVQPYRTQQGCTRRRWKAERGEAALGWKSQAAFEAGCGQSGTL